MFNLGDLVRVAADNDNDNYDGFRDKTLVITGVFTSELEHPGYDNSLEGMALYEFEDESGNGINCALYEYEIEEA